MSQSKKQIHDLKDFGRVELFLNTYVHWNVLLAVIIQIVTIIMDLANTDYWLALQGRGPFTVLQWQLMIAWCIIRAILGGLVIVYMATRLNHHISTRNYEQIAEDDIFFGKEGVKFPWLLGCTILFSVTTYGIGLIVLLVPMIVFVFSSPYKLQSWTNDEKTFNVNMNTTDAIEALVWFLPLLHVFPYRRRPFDLAGLEFLEPVHDEPVVFPPESCGCRDNFRVLPENQVLDRFHGCWRHLLSTKDYN